MNKKIIFFLLTLSFVSEDFFAVPPNFLTEKINKNHIEHFEILPEILGCKVEHDSDLKIVETPFPTSMFNIVFGIPKSLSAVNLVVDRFKDKPFAWWVPTTDQDSKNTAMLLEKCGLKKETNEHAMVCDLRCLESNTLECKTNLDVKPVVNCEILQDFISVINPYDCYACNFYQSLSKDDLVYLNEKDFFSERLFVGYSQGKPATIGILYISDNKTCSIFCLITHEEMRGQGYGTDMMKFLLQAGKRLKCDLVTLSASSDSGFKIYEKLGFKKYGEFQCYEWSLK